MTRSLLALALLASCACAADEPQYQDRSLAHWLEVLQKSGKYSEKERWTAAEVFAQMSPGDRRALPILLREIEREDPTTAATLAFAFRRIGPASIDLLRDELKSDKPERRRAVLRMLTL